MSYFCAVLGRGAAGWRALDVDLEGVESLAELDDLVRAVGAPGLVLAVVEREDAWFGLVAVDVGEDARAFVSDLEASRRGPYAALLAPLADLDPSEYAYLRTVRAPAPALAAVPLADFVVELADDPRTDQDDPLLAEADEDLAEAAREPDLPPPWAGDPGLLEVLGVPAQELVELVVADPDDPGAVLAELGERCGFDDLIDALR